MMKPVERVFLAGNINVKKESRIQLEMFYNTLSLKVYDLTTSGLTCEMGIMGSPI